jgi:hypothetical protein
MRMSAAGRKYQTEGEVRVSVMNVFLELTGDCHKHYTLIGREIFEKKKDCGQMPAILLFFEINTLFTLR